MDHFHKYKFKEVCAVFSKKISRTEASIECSTILVTRTIYTVRDLIFYWLRNKKPRIEMYIIKEFSF